MGTNELKIGDLLCCGLAIAKVEKITKTMYILSNGDRVKSSFGESYIVVGTGKGWDRAVYWYKLTDEKLSEINKKKREKKIRKWFDDQSFNSNQLEQIYKLFNNECEKSHIDSLELKIK